MLRCWCAILLIAVCIPQAQGKEESTQARQEFVASIRLDKASFKVGEPVTGEITVTNLGGRSLDVAIPGLNGATRLNRIATTRVVDEQGRVQFVCQNTSTSYNSETEVLLLATDVELDEIIEQAVTLQSEEQVPKPLEKKGDFITFKFDATSFTEFVNQGKEVVIPGTYRMTFALTISGDSQWTGQLKAKPVTFKVVK